jgi:hypothetical protein
VYNIKGGIAMKFMRRFMSLILVIGALAAAAGVFAVPVSAATAAQISWKGKLTPGQTNHTIAYWWDTSVSTAYQNRIVTAREKIMYPTGMSNPIILWRTTVNNDSKMDFYQINTDSIFNMATYLYKKDTPTSAYRKLNTSELDTTNWVYGIINIYDKNVKNFSNTYKEVIIMHEMMHVYGGKDIFGDTTSIMCGLALPNLTGLTADANQLLINKYSN